MKKNNVKQYMRAKEVSEYVGIGLSTVWNFAKEGKITPIKISPRVTVFEIDEINNKLIGSR
jgi:predicted DNA-binding transcriptional regulator AlpA